MTAKEIKSLNLIEQALDTVSHEIEIIRELQKRNEAVIKASVKEVEQELKNEKIVNELVN
jgi:16S rRNA C1402 (ribose-2'-O) methylase RsmI